ncbi:MAG: response regulator [Nitrosopumilaceae archaeon]
MKILCVEDDLDIATLLDNTLSASGHHVSTCNDGLEAVSQIQSGEFNLIFLDLGIPELSGNEVIDRLANDDLLDSLNIVILSANDLTQGEQENFAKKGIKEILKKPVSLEKILQAVERFE